MTKTIITLACIIGVTITGLTSAFADDLSSSFNPVAFALKQSANIKAEGQAYDTIANAQISALQAYLKSYSPLSGGYGATPPSGGGYGATPPSGGGDLGAETPKSPDGDSTPATDSQSTLPIANDNNNKKSTWNYKL